MHDGLASTRKRGTVRAGLGRCLSGMAPALAVVLVVARNVLS